MKMFLNNYPVQFSSVSSIFYYLTVSYMLVDFGTDYIDVKMGMGDRLRCVEKLVDDASFSFK